ncbi:MAG: L,D-transpeptidase [Gemmatimonadaceae bacterium]
MLRRTLGPAARPSRGGGAGRRACGALARSIVAAALLLLQPAAGGTQAAPALVPRLDLPVLANPLLAAATGVVAVAAVVDSLAASAPDSALTIAAPLRPRYVSRADSIASVSARRAARRDPRLRVVISLFDRQVYVLRGGDTLRVAPAAVASRDTLVYDGHVWTFDTPPGRRVVRGKEPNPYWTPPDWHYAEVARDYGLWLARIPRRGVTLADGSRLVIRDRRVGLLPPGSARVEPLPTDEEIVLGDTLFVPPMGTINRRIVGELGRYRLDLGDGFLLHGTPDEATVGAAVTHGCVRLRDADISWLYDNVPVGTPVYIY